jgi:hypothetical protein
MLAFQGGAMHGSGPHGQDGLLVKGFFVGALVGGVAAWLFAPCKGAQLRAWLEDTLRDTIIKTWTTIRMVLPGSTDN